MNLEDLYKIIVDSYTASLFRDGEDRIIQKVGEEATEVIIAAKGKSRERIISEMADLWFHTLVLLSNFNITPKDIFRELQKRRK